MTDQIALFPRVSVKYGCMDRVDRYSFGDAFYYQAVANGELQAHRFRANGGRYAGTVIFTNLFERDERDLNPEAHRTIVAAAKRLEHLSRHPDIELTYDGPVSPEDAQHTAWRIEAVRASYIEAMAQAEQHSEDPEFFGY